MAFFGPSSDATAIATAIQAAIGNNASATDIATEIQIAIGSNPSAQQIADAISASIVKTPLVRYLDENGDGTGNFSANVDGSSTPVEFFIEPPASTIFVINDFSVFIQDNGELEQDNYGTTITLGTGIDLEVKINAVFTRGFANLYTP